MIKEENDAKLKSLISEVGDLRYGIHGNKKYDEAVKLARHYLHVASYHLWDKEKEIIPKDFDFYVGDKLVCINQDDEDVDFGASGFVLPGNRDLKLNKEYEIEGFLFRHVPENKGTWTPKEYKKVQLYWVMVWLKGLDKPQYLRFFKKEEIIPF